jgi:agmatine deiminase
MSSLGNGIEGDDTHGHIDDLCRFINEDTIVTYITNTEHYIPLQDNLKRYKALEKFQSSWFLPMPKRLDFEDLRLPASYAYFE